MQERTFLWLLKCRTAKGQIKPKADWRAIYSPKKRKNEFVFFCHNSPEILETWNLNFKFQVFPDCKAKKTSSFVRFLGESMARQSAFGFIWPLEQFSCPWITLVQSWGRLRPLHSLVPTCFLSYSAGTVTSCNKSTQF